MSTYGVSSTGFLGKIFSQCLQELTDIFASVFGTGILNGSGQLDPTQPLGQLANIFAEREAQLWQFMQGLYYSQYPDSAEGVSLDNVLAIAIIPRKPATFSTIPGVVLTGTPGTNIYAATFQAAVVGNPASIFIPVADSVIGGGGTVAVDFIAQTAGAVSAPENQLTVIDTLVAGLTSMTNPNAAVVGDDIETDGAYLLRSYTEKQQANAGPVNAIISFLMKVQNVTGVTVVQNTTMATVNGVPAKAVNCIVQGGTDQDVANAIFAAVGAGIEAYGGTVMSVLDSQGFTHSIGFDRPSAVDIYVDIEITQIPGQTITEAAVQDAVMVYGNSLAQGQNVIVIPGIVSSMVALPASDIVIKVGIAPTPTLSNNIAIALNQYAVFDPARITVTIL